MAAAAAASSAGPSKGSGPGSKDLQDQAAAAALYVTEPQRQVRDARKDANWPLDANGKLTSAGAASSLKRAEARDLPSYPSVGLASSAAGGAAFHANQNARSPQWWKPEGASAGASAGASKAASMAHEQKMALLGKTEQSAAGSRAAVLAHQRGNVTQTSEPTASEKALIAATGAVSGNKGKTKSEEVSVERYPDERNASRNALNAATMVHRNSSRGRSSDLPGLSDEEADKVRKQATVAGMNAEMFTSTPLIGPELEERKHQAGLHAAAVSMAQGMYGKREKAYREKTEAARVGSRHRAGRNLDEDSDQEDTPMSFMGLQETAQKLANERLARLNDPDEDYRKHWGTHSPPPKNRLSVFGAVGRTKSSSEEVPDPDERESRRIRGEQNLFKDKLKEIDERKRKEDRQTLMAAAQRNVQKDMTDMDEDVFHRTGKMSPAMRAEWEAKARAKAKAESENRKSNYGKVALGGGKYLDQTEIDAIAQSRLQPTLDAITAKAEHDREAEEKHKIEEEERKRIERENKEVEKEKDRQLKAEWKLFRAEEKAEKKEREAKEKAEKRKSKQAAKDNKMQEKFDETVHKEEEQDVEREQETADRTTKEAEKEHDKEIKAEWKLFKRQEKRREEEEKAARKREAEARREIDPATKKENRLSSIFRRKSRKESEELAQAPEPQMEEAPIPGVVANTTTVIVGGAAAAVVAEDVVVTQPQAQPQAQPQRDSVISDEEPQPETLTSTDEVPEASSPARPKSGGEFMGLFKRKKQEREDRKRQSVDADDKAPLVNGSTVVGKDEPGKAQPSTGEPAPEALAPEHVKAESKEESKVESKEQTSTAALAGGAAAGSAVAGAALATPVVAVTEQDETKDKAVNPPSTPPQQISEPVTEKKPSPVLVPVITEPEVTQPEPKQPEIKQPEVTKSEAVKPEATKLEAAKPEATAAEPIKQEPTKPEPTKQAVVAEEKSVTPTEPVEPPTQVIKEEEVVKTTAPASLPTPDASKANENSFTAEMSMAVAAMAVRPNPARADTSKTNEAESPSNFVDAPTSPLKEESTVNEPIVTASSGLTGGATEPTAVDKTVAATEGQKHEEPLEERIGVPSETTAAAQEAVDEKGTGGTPRAKEAKEKSSNRLSGFFRNKLGAAGKKLNKDQKAQDGTVLSPTTSATTHGKFVDPADKHSDMVPAQVPANKELLEREDQAQGIAVDASHDADTTDKPEKSSKTRKANKSSRADKSDASSFRRHSRRDPPEYDSNTIIPGTRYVVRKEDRGRNQLQNGANDIVTDGGPPQLPPIIGAGSSSALRSGESPLRETRFKEEI